VDSRSFRDAAMQDFPKRFPVFEDSPITELCKVSDICYYKDGVRKTDAELGKDAEGNQIPFDLKNKEHYHVLPDLNKIDKIGRTSWDSFSYALQMGHNVYLHIYAVQEANRQYDAGSLPSMMEFQNAKNGAKFRDIVEAIFSAPSKDDALAIIKHYERYWVEILGNHGFIGKKVINANTSYERMVKDGVLVEETTSMSVEEADATDMDIATSFNPDNL
jgi:hypothetical protein